MDKKKWIGLKDKNGKKIYEGDIVETAVRNAGGFDNVWVKVKARIEYKPEYGARYYATIIWKEVDRTVIQIDLMYPGLLEVIEEDK